MRFSITLVSILIMIFVSNPIFLPDNKVKMEVSMANGLEPKQVADLEELLMSQVVRQEALIKLLVKKGIFSNQEFLDMVNVVNKEMKPISIRLPPPVAPVEGR